MLLSGVKIMYGVLVEARAINDEFDSFEGWSNRWSTANYSGGSGFKLIPERTAY